MTKIDSDIVHFAAQNTKELALRVRRLLIVEAPQDPALGSGMILLHEDLVNPDGGKLRTPIGLHEEPARVGNNVRIDQENFRDRESLKSERHG